MGRKSYAQLLAEGKIDETTGKIKVSIDTSSTQKDPVKSGGKITPVLALNIRGELTYCSAPPEFRGKGRCNHIAHAEIGEEPKDFFNRIENLRKEAEDDFVVKLGNNEFTFLKFEDDDTANISTDVYRMTDEEKKELTKIEAKWQLEKDLNDNGYYIHTDTPLWNDMDKAKFAEISGMSVKGIDAVLNSEAVVITDSRDDERMKPGRLLSASDADSVDEFYSKHQVGLGTGLEGMNELAENLGFKATTDIYVLPYYMRIGTVDQNGQPVESDLTVAYQYLFRNRTNPEKMQVAYSALLNNQQLDKDKARYDGRYKKKSLVDEFAGKSGIARGQLSGRNIPYAARAVISPDASVEYGDAAIPPSIAVDIFRPTLLKQFAKEGRSEEYIESYFKKYRVRQDEISQADRLDLEARISGGYGNDEFYRARRVLLNRQPSLHRNSMQGYVPTIAGVDRELKNEIGYKFDKDKLSEEQRNRLSNGGYMKGGGTLQLNPLYYSGYNADNDGDTLTIAAINTSDEGLQEIVDKEFGKGNILNTRKARSLETSEILPSKESLYGIRHILKKRSK